MTNFHKEVSLDATDAAFLVVYSMYEKMAAVNAEGLGPGKQEYITMNTCVGTVRLPILSKLPARVRLAKNQILGQWRITQDRMGRDAVDSLIGTSFKGGQISKRDLREAYRRFKVAASQFSQ